MDAGIHCIDAVRFLVGDPVNLLGAMTEQIPTESVERNAVCRFTAAGVICFVQVCSQAPYLSRLSISGTNGEIVVDKIYLYSSTLTPKGPVYEVAEEFGLN